MHRARLKLSKTDVAVKVRISISCFIILSCCLLCFMWPICLWQSGTLQVQHPGAEKLMMVDIRNMQAFALFLQKYDINFDLYSATKEMEKQVFIQFNTSVFFCCLSHCTCLNLFENLDKFQTSYGIIFLTCTNQNSIRFFVFNLLCLSGEMEDVTNRTTQAIWNERMSNNTWYEINPIIQLL